MRLRNLPLSRPDARLRGTRDAGDKSGSAADLRHAPAQMGGYPPSSRRHRAVDTLCASTHAQRGRLRALCERRAILPFSMIELNDASARHKPRSGGRNAASHALRHPHHATSHPVHCTTTRDPLKHLPPTKVLESCARPLVASGAPLPRQPPCSWAAPPPPCPHAQAAPRRPAKVAALTWRIPWSFIQPASSNSRAG